MEIAARPAVNFACFAAVLLIVFNAKMDIKFL
jgi:hypothetical protein